MDAASPRDRFRGAIVGTAVGDALGAPFEGQARADPAAFAAWQRDDVPLRWTDDTAMTVGVAESLIACGTFDGADMAQRFVAHYDNEPWRGYGSGPPRVFAAIRGGAAWHEPATQLFGGQGSYGNGAAMRVAPVGLLFFRRLTRVAEVARASATISHSHELARQGAAVQAYAVAWLASLQAEPGPSAARDLIGELRPLAPAAAYQHALDRVVALDADGSGDTSNVRERAVAQLGNGIAAAEAVPAALHAMLRHRHSFADAVGYAVSLGGDTDTIAAMTGALSGALLGHDAIPGAWLQRLEAHDDLLGLADGLYRTSGAPEAPARP